MRKMIQEWMRRKNPDFQLDSDLSTGLLLVFVWQKLRCQLRALRLLLWGHSPFTVFLGRGVKIFNGRNIHFGSWVQLEDQVYISALGRQSVRLGDKVRIGAYSRLVISTSFNDPGKGIRIGNNVGIGEFAYLGGAGGLEIGEDCIIGQYLSCHPENHHFDQQEIPIRLQGVERKGIRIGANCWIGAKVTLLDGVNIGANCVVAAGAVVTKSMPANSLIGGVPARIIRSLSESSPSTQVAKQARGYSYKMGPLQIY